MKKIAFLVGIVVLAPAWSLAHEQQHFLINGKEYHFTIGSIGEPVAVDDKSGVDLRVSTPGAHSAAGDHDAGLPVSGLESSLKVELIAGETKKVQSLSPVYGIPGSYKTTFYPTVATTLTYRVFGELNGTPINLSFSCTPSGHERAPESAERVEISQNVTRIFKTGGYGCPEEKSDLGFPEPSAELAQHAHALENTTDPRVAYAALILSFLALSATFVRSRV